MVRFIEVNKKFGKLQVLDNVSIDVEEGIRTAILGPNGSGKTTLIKTLLGMVIPDSGEVLFKGESVLGKYKYRREIVYMPQIALFPQNLTVKELLDLIPKLRMQPAKYDGLIERFGVNEFMHKKMNALSGGMRQKVNLVLAFMFDVPLIILDEPTNGLDPVAVLELKKLLREEEEKGRTIIFTSHIMDFVQQMADRIVFLLEGVVKFKGTVEEILQETDSTSLEEAVASLILKSQKVHNYA
ncbi:MAG: ABC transporter ATP-binding protein [Chlorobi bacterium]|nr:ABC transporter ATP-binding protein [Chlorobiota bacterium]